MLFLSSDPLAITVEEVFVKSVGSLKLLWHLSKSQEVHTTEVCARGVYDHLSFREM